MGLVVWLLVCGGGGGSTGGTTGGGGGGTVVGRLDAAWGTGALVGGFAVQCLQVQSGR